MALESIPREQVLSVIANVGPVQPLDVRRHLGSGDTMLIGAMLSEMAANGTVAISQTKRGGSPFYYDPKRPDSLERLGQFLNEKDQRTLALLKEKKLLREDKLEPLTRVSLQNIPDFSRRFEVNGIAYWRYYLVPQSELTRKASPPKQQPEVAEMKPKETPPAHPPAPKQTTLAPEWATADELYQKVAAFVQQANGALINQTQVKPNAELTCTMTTQGQHGELHTTVYAFSRKTLPETLVWTALLEARKEGLPLLVLKDSPFPKSLEKKFSNVPNVYFQQI